MEKIFTRELLVVEISDVSLFDCSPFFDFFIRYIYLVVCVRVFGEIVFGLFEFGEFVFGEFAFGLMVQMQILLSGKAVNLFV